MVNSRITLILLTIVILGIPGSLWAHCEVPCGIYDDRARVALMAEHIDTIEKAMQQVTRLRKEDPVNYNQIVRWVMTKEAHAEKIQHTVSQYFLTQRIKPDQAKTTEKIAVLHKMLVAAMKCKQSIDPQHPADLRRLLADFEALYF